MVRARNGIATTLAFAGTFIGIPAALISPASTSRAATVPVCTASALTLAVGFTQAAAGNEGFPVIITNHGSTACSLDGFASLSAHTRARSPHLVTFVHVSRSQIFATAKAKLVIVSPKATASFGVSFVDGLNQRYGQGPHCQMNSITVHLPAVIPLSRDTLVFIKRGDGFGGWFNSCFAGFEFGLTPIVKGSQPPYY